MIVYLETNAILHIALKQQHRAITERFVGMGRKALIELRIPAIALAEAHYPVRERESLTRQLISQSQELSRVMQGSSAKAYANAVAAANVLESQMVSILGTERQSLQRSVCSLARAIASIPLTGGIFAQAYRLMSELDLEDFDALICATIFEDAKQHSGADKVLLSYDARLVAAIRPKCKQYKIKAFSDPQNCLNYILHLLPS